MSISTLVPSSWRHVLFAADTLALKSEHLGAEAEAIKAELQARASSRPASKADLTDNCMPADKASGPAVISHVPTVPR